MDSGSAERTTWFLALAACTVITAVSFVEFDVPLAHFVHSSALPSKFLEKYLRSSVLLTIEVGMVLALALLRLLKGRISPFWMTLWVACAASIGAYLVNTLFFKVIFGVPNPNQVLHGARHTLHWFSGTEDSSFPSGHMMLASAFAGVFMRQYRAAFWPLISALGVAAIVLLVGDWHFLSDLIIGTFIGISAGFAVADRWMDRSSSPDLSD